MNVVTLTDKFFPNGGLAPLKIDKMKFLVIHHIDADTATPEEIHQWHISFGWSGAGYNEYITKDGTVYIMRGDNIGAQCAGFNSCSYGIAVEGNFEKPTQMPYIQYMKLLERCKINLARFPKNCVIVPHRELVNTTCPGKYFPFEQLLKDAQIPMYTEFDTVLKKLTENKIISSPEYWKMLEKDGALANGKFVKMVFENMVKFINQL